MASRALLDQVICESTQSCNTKSPDVAIGSVISAQVAQSKSNNNQLNVVIGPESAYWFNGGDLRLTLQEISKSGKVATGQCTREKELFDFHQNSKINSGYPLSMQLEIVFATYQQSLNTLSADQLKQGRALHTRQWIENYSKSIDSKSVLFLEPALAKAKDFDEFVRLVLLPAECKDKSIQLPPFRIVTFSETEPSIIEERLDEGLKRKRLVSLSVCSSKLSNAAQEECGAHAVVVSQSRIKCTGAKCEKEYRFLDSSFFPKTVRNQDGSYWLPKEMVIQATQAHGLYITKTINNIQSEYNKNFNTYLSEFKKSILDYETFLLNMKIELQKILDDYHVYMIETREKSKKDLSKLTPQQRAEAIKQNPWLAMVYDEDVFNKLLNDEKAKTSAKMEQMRKRGEEALQNSKQQMDQFSQKIITNFAISKQNIIWLE